MFFLDDFKAWPPKTCLFFWVVLSDEQMSKRWQFSLLNDEQMSNWVGVEHLPIFVYFKFVCFEQYLKKTGGHR